MPQALLRGRVWRFGQNVDTDQIYPGRFLTGRLSPADIAGHAMEGAGHPRFQAEAGPGDIIVAGPNFGCGSSREHAAACLKHRGMAAVVAESFARIFFRNCFAIGLPVVECGGIGAVPEGHTLEVDLATGQVRDLDTGAAYPARPIPGFLLRMLDMGGLIPLLEASLAPPSTEEGKE